MPIHINSKTISLNSHLREKETERERERERETYIRGIADEFTKEDLFVAVEGVDDQAEKLVDLSLESEGLCISHLHVSHYCTKRKRARENERKKAREKQREIFLERVESN